MKSIFSSTPRSRRHRQTPTPESHEEMQPFFGQSETGNEVQSKTQPFFQAKLSIGRPNDPYEKEADAVADKVVGGNNNAAPAVQAKDISSIQRLATPDEEKMPSTNDGRMEEDRAIQEKAEPGPKDEEDLVQKMDEPDEKDKPIQEKPEEKEELQAKSETGGGTAAPSNLSAKLSQSRGKGEPLPKPVRTEMEQGIGADFSGVRIHRDSESEGMNKGLHAQAFTHGTDVYFNAGKFNPENTDGKRLLAHELTHVVQQGGDRISRRTDMDAEAQEEQRMTTEEAKEIIKKYKSNTAIAQELFFRLNQNAKDIYADWKNREIAQAVVSLCASKNELLKSFISLFTEDQIRNSKGNVRSFLTTSIRIFREAGNVADAKKVASLIVSPEHAHLLAEDFGNEEKIAGSLKDKDASVQSITGGGADHIVFDEYSVTIDQMPVGLSPEKFLLEMAYDLNAAVKNDIFDDINEFKRDKSEKEKTQLPVVGDVYDIDIQGPDDGSVVLVEQTSNHFIFQTITRSIFSTGSHPEYGSREFGFERMADKSIRFYTRGASRASNNIVFIIGSVKQKQGWTALVTGIQNELKKRGGKPRAGSIKNWTLLS